MIDYDKMKKIHSITNRVRNSAGVTEDNISFIYMSNNQYVKKGTPYHIHYTTDLKEHYMTGRTHNMFSRLIKPMKPELVSDFSKYTTNLSKKYRKLYQKPFRGKPKPNDYVSGTFVRYFAKKINDPEVPVFEVNVNFKSPLYQIFTLKWRISGGKMGVIRQHNKNITERLIRQIPGIKKLLTNYTEFYIRPQLTEDLQIQKELGMLTVRRDKDGNKVFVDQPIKKPLNMKMRKGSKFGKGGITGFKLNPKFFNK